MPARDAVHAFKPDADKAQEAVIKASAFDTMQHYEDQIRSVLPV